MKTFRLFVAPFFVFSILLTSLNLFGQTGIYKTRKDYEMNNLTAADELGWSSTAFGSTIKTTRGKETEKYTNKDIFAFVQDSSFYRFYKYACVNTLIRGDLSFYALVPAKLEFDEKERIITLSRESYIGGLKIFMSKGQGGEVEPVTRKRLREYFAGKKDVLAEIDKKGFDYLQFFIWYNLTYPMEDGFVMNGKKPISFAEVERITKAE